MTAGSARHVFAIAVLVATTGWTGSVFAQSIPRCVVDDEVSEWRFPSCALIVRQGAQYIPSKYMRGALFNQYGLVGLGLDQGGRVYVNREGRIVIRYVALMDNGADPFHHGLVRLERSGKYGFADPKGRIVVPIRYDGAMNSDEYGPSICVGCKAEGDGEYHYFTGGQWFTLDSGGRLHRRAESPYSAMTPRKGG